MAYRKSHKELQRLAAMRAAKERKRLEGPLPEYAVDIPDLRRRIIVIDYDSGNAVTHTIDLHRTRRIDQYRAVVDGVEWKKRIGFSGVLAGIRKAMPRVSVALIK